MGDRELTSDGPDERPGGRPGSPPNGQDRSPPALRDPALLLAAAGTIATLALLFTIVASPTFTNDFWFHLKMGEVYFSEGPWPAADPMLFTANEDAPVQHEWLFGVGIWAVERLAGFQAIRVVHTLAVALALWLAFSITLRETDDRVIACGVTTAFALLGWTRFFQVRPDLFSICATLLVLPLVRADSSVKPTTRVASWALLSLVWANVHSLFALGPLLLIAAGLGLVLRGAQDAWLVEADRRSDAWARALMDARVLAAAFIAGLLATLVNPRGIGQHLTFFSSSREAAIWAVRDEWSNFDPLHVWGNPGSVGPLLWGLADFALVAFALATCIGLWSTWRREQRAHALFDPVLFGLGLASIVAFMVSVRFLWMAFFPLLFAFETLAVLLRSAYPRTRVVVRWGLAFACCVMALLFDRIGGYRNVAQKLPDTIAEYVTTPYMTRKYHVEGVRFLRDSGVEGRLFNSYAMGGFLGYWLSPRLRTFIDSRTEHYPPEVLVDYDRITKMKDLGPGATFLDLLDRAEVDFFFGIGYPVPPPMRPNGVYTTLHLDRVPGWIPVSRSLHHTIYLRDVPRNEENLRRIEAYHAEAGIPFDRERGLDASDAVAANRAWAVESGLLTPGQSQRLEGLDAADPKQRVLALETLGLVYSLTGDHESLLENEAALAALKPDSLASRRRLVHALMRLDRPGEALETAWELQRLDLSDSHSQLFVQHALAYKKLSAALAGPRDPIARRVTLNRLIGRLALLSGFEAGLIDLGYPGQPRLDR